VKFDLVILDVDGVLTDGKKYYGLDGIPFAKTYCDKDFTAIKRMRGSGMSVCFLSGDERVNKAMAANRNIDFFSARGKDKSEFIPELSERYNTTPERMIYVGDDLFDISIMKAVGLSFCPFDSPEIVKNVSGQKVLSRGGGNNVIAEMVDLLIADGSIKDCTMEDIENLDKNEKF